MRVARVLAVATIMVIVACVAVIFTAIRTSSPCDGIAFHLPEASQAPTPPVGGQQPVLQRIRRAFRIDRTSVSYCHDFADPFVLRVGDSYFAYSTNSAERNIPVLYGSGIFGTQRISDALPTLPRWSTRGRVWAPAILPTSRGYALYYATLNRSDGAECLSVAFAETPIGPFEDNSRRPMRCDAIDPRPFRTADGGAQLLWSEPGSIHVARLASDLRTLRGPVQELLRADQPWEAGIVEAPTMLASRRGYDLFYSANRWDTVAYAIGYAHCATTRGPCQKTTRPWLTSPGTILGPGGQDVFTDGDGRLWMVLHAWIGPVGYPRGARYLFVVPLTIRNDRPIVQTGA